MRRAPSHSEEASRAHTGPGPGLAVFLPCLSFSIFMPPYRFLHQTRLCVFLNPVSHCCWNRALGPRAAAALGRENGRALHPTPDLPGVWSGSGCPHRPTRPKRGHPAVHAVLSSALAAVCPPPSMCAHYDDLALRGGQCLHGTQSPPRSLTPDRSVAVRCLPVAASPGLCPPAGPCLDSGVLGGCTQQAVSKCPIVFVTCGTAVGQACPRAAARLARGSWCGAGLTRRSSALELPGRSCPTAAQWREGTAALSSCVVTAGRFRAPAACRPQPAAGAVRGSLFQACAKGSPSLLLPGCCLDGTLYSPRPQGA